MTTASYIEVAAYTIAFIVWLVRLEMKVKNVAEEFEHCKRISEGCRIDQTRRYEVVRGKLDELLKSVGWIQGYLKQNGNGKENHDA